jgi:hypothetical protein
MDIFNSNQKIIDFIKNDKIFSIIRLGLGEETYLTFEYVISGKINTEYLKPIYNLNGIYSKNNELDKFELFCQHYHEGIKSADLIGYVNYDFKNFLKIQDLFTLESNLIKIHSRSLEPFYVMLEQKIPWTHFLINKKVLIINPFVDSFQKQIENGFSIFKNQKVFLEGQKFVFYKSFNTLSNNKIHQDWYQSFNIMKEDIKKLDFDIALLSCGGYGLPLCDFIKSELKKSCIYVGGGLQLLFGVMGKRWENLDLWKKIIKENNTKFIRPSDNEKINQYQSIENGCYW